MEYLGRLFEVFKSPEKAGKKGYGDIKWWKRCAVLYERWEEMADEWRCGRECGDVLRRRNVGLLAAEAVRAYVNAVKRTIGEGVEGEEKGFEEW